MVLEGGDTKWFPLCCRRDSWKGNFSFRLVSSGRNISKKVKAMPHDISSPFSEILSYPGELLEFCVVTSVIEMPTALKTHSLLTRLAYRNIV